ncbi:hypothetical protein RN001_001331 [Aquatica leii]|uniref:Fibronectin type-III domain-containing protein n=1 Tax=Aquatica leii TaxID=1421715 RepID=A0AAN7SSM0_9COLE|nr:hypothetical protein RN001_001331 [Aquatica leii]
MTFFAVTFVLVLLLRYNNCLECPPGIDDGSCTAYTDLNETMEILTYTDKPLPRPPSFNMMTEDHEDRMDKTLKTKALPSTTQESIITPVDSTAKFLEEPKGRSLNFTLHDHNHENELSKSKKSFEDLSDVSMDDDDGVDITVATMPAVPKLTNEKIVSFCNLNGLTYDHGEKLESGCDSICHCLNGTMNCTDRCLKPFFKKGQKISEKCVEQDTEDPCCSTVVCESKIEKIHEETCMYKNKMYNKDVKIEDGCSSICICEPSGSVTCKPRCKSVDKPLDKCVEVPDPQDSCCKKLLCDVTLNDHDAERDQEEPQKIRLTSAKVLNNSTVKLDFDPPLKKNYTVPEIEGSINKNTWKTLKLSIEGLLKNQDLNIRFFKIKNTNDVIELTDNFQETKKTSYKCEYKGHQLKLGEEYNDNCASLCVCRQNGIQCLKMECPTYFGVDVLNPSCIEWESDPPDFVPSPPNCCPKSVKCKNNGSCDYKGESYSNWQQIPINITGCEKRCYCEMGKVECQNICPPVTALPPASLSCPPQLASLSHLPDDDCCMYWVCNSENSLPGNNGQFPAGFPLIPPGFQQSQDEVNVYVLEAIDAHSIRLGFSVPPIIVGLHGQIDIRYTDENNNNNPNTWQSQIFTPPNDLIETQQLEVALQGLKEDTEYKIKIIVTLRDLHNIPSSRIYTVRTMKDESLTTQPPLIPIEPDLVVTDINATWVNIAWRKFSEKELQYVDGVQLRYREIDGKIYAATPLIHRAVTTYTLENLKPNTKYEAGIFLIPFPGQLTELHSENMIHFATANEVDNYGFNVTLEIGTVKATSVEITWSGVPYPEDKYVNIYRAIYQSDSGKGDFSTFKVAKRDSPPKATIMDLKPGIRYRLWLEVYLTNGRIKTSNVQDFVTKPRSVSSLGASTQQGKLESGDFPEHRGDYYGPLVIVAILAAVAIISTLILLLILVKRHSQNKAAITPPPRISQSAYDNPTYKVEIQQETMNL